jgi:cytochrome P450
MTAPTTVRPPIVIGSPEFAADPAPHYTWLRENAPVSRVGFDFGAFAAEFWVLSRYADCRSLLSDPRLARSPHASGSGRIPADLDDIHLVTTATLDMQDGGAHKRLRSLVAAPFTPMRIEKLGDRVRALAGERLDVLARGNGGNGRIDLRQEFALPITLTVIAEMLGVAEFERPRFLQGVTALMSDFNGSQEDWQQRVADIVDLTRVLIVRKRTEPGDDIVTGLIQAEEAGDRLRDHELVAMVFSLLTAGYETTYNLITNAAAALLTHRDQLARLLTAPEDTALWRSALEEVGRFTPPISGTRPLTVVEDIVVRGIVIPAGERVMPLLAAANRDPEAFDVPERFDITRKPNHHLGFGHGAHFCLGANLARMEARVALQVLFERHPGVVLAVDDEELVLEPMPLWTRYRKLPVRLGRA